MPWGIAAGVVGSVAGAAVSSAMSPSTSGGSGGGGGGPSYYIPTGLQSADQQWQNIQNQNYNRYMGYNLDQYGLSSLDQGINAGNQYAPGLQAGANLAGQTYGNLANTLLGESSANYGVQQGLLNAGQNVYNTALDPQNALYNRTVQQLQDQTGATNSMYGLGSSGAGAGIANQALGNFNIDWQNNQLARQAQGLQAYGQAAQQAGQYGQFATQQAEAAPGYQLAAGQTPYTAAQNIAANPGQVAGQFGSFLNQNVYGPGQGLQNQFIPYANYGQGAQQVPFQGAQQGAGAAGALLSQGIQGIGSNPQLQSSLGNIFGGNPAQGYFGSTQTPGNYAGTGYGGYGMGVGGDYYSGGGNSYGFTM